MKKIFTIPFTGIKIQYSYKNKKKTDTAQSIAPEVKPQIVIQNHPVYEKFAGMFRDIVLRMTKAPDYGQVSSRMNNDMSSILSYGGEDRVFVKPLEYIEEMDKDNPLCTILILKATLVQTKSDNLA